MGSQGRCCQQACKGIFLSSPVQCIPLAVKLITQLIHLNENCVVAGQCCHYACHAQISCPVLLSSFYRNHNCADHDHHQHPPQGDLAEDSLCQSNRYLPDGMLCVCVPGVAGICLCKLYILWERTPTSKKGSRQGRTCYRRKEQTGNKQSPGKKFKLTFQTLFLPWQCWYVWQ